MGQASNKPPAVITKSVDCDWLLWFIWREACRVEPTDPESVITELENSCAETQLTLQPTQEGNDEYFIKLLGNI